TTGVSGVPRRPARAPGARDEPPQPAAGWHRRRPCRYDLRHRWPEPSTTPTKPRPGFVVNPRIVLVVVSLLLSVALGVTLSSGSGRSDRDAGDDRITIGLSL